MKRNVLGVMLAGALAAAAISGCGASSENGSTASSGSGEARASESEDTASSADDDTAVSESEDMATAESEEMTLKLWHIWPEGSGVSADVLSQVIADAEEKYPGLHFEIDSVADVGDNYKTKIKTAMAGGEIPDVFFTWGGGFSESFIEAGRCLALNDYLSDETLERVAGGGLDFFTYGDQFYGVPTDAGYGLLYCNEAMFRDAGLEIPTTYGELLDVVSAFTQQGTIPFALGGKGQDSTGWFIWQLVEREAGADYVGKVLSGEATFDTPEMLKAAQDFKELVDAGAFDPNVVAMAKDEAEALFLEGVYPMYFCGSWFSGTIFASDSANNDDFTCVAFPVIEGGKGAATEFVGGAGNTLMISSEVENPEKVAEIVAYIIENYSCNQFLAGAGLPAWKVNTEDSAIENPLLAQAYDVTSSVTASNQWWDNYLSAEKATTQLELNTKLLMGEITPEEWVALNTENTQ